MTEQHPDGWRLGAFDRAIACAVYFAFVGIMLGTTTAEFGVDSLQFVVGAVVCGLVALVVWALAFRPVIRICGATLVVRNPIRLRVIPRDRIRSVQADYFGIAIAVDGEKRCLAIAAQKSQAQLALGTRSRSDDIAETIRRWGNGQA